MGLSGGVSVHDGGRGLSPPSSAAVLAAPVTLWDQIRTNIKGLARSPSARIAHIHALIASRLAGLSLADLEGFFAA
jgi:hypothetical protein